MSPRCDHDNLVVMILFGACLFSSLALFSQSSGVSGTISGTVVGANGLPVEGATVFLKSSSSADQKRAETDKTGKFFFSRLSIGAYKLSASARGFKESTKIVLVTSASVTVNLTLSPAPGGASKTGQASPDSDSSFSSAGVRGTTAPSGYSSGLSNEEVAHVRATVNALEPTTIGALASGGDVDCGHEPVLLHDVQQAPQKFAPNFALGHFYLRHQEYSKAIQYLGRAHSLIPTDLVNSQELAIALTAAGRGSGAATLLEQLLVDHGTDPLSVRLLAFAYGAAGEREKAIAAFQKAAASDSSTDNQYDCGIGLIKTGAFREAADLFTAARKRNPDSPRLWLGVGIAEYLLDHKKEAVSALLHSADADRDFLPPLVVLAGLSNLPDDTKTEIRRRIAGYVGAHASDAEGHFIYALILSKEVGLEQNARQEMMSQLTRALELNPRMADAHFLLAETEDQLDSLPKAIDEFLEVLKLEPRNPAAHYRLSLLYRRDNQLENARKEMDAYRALRAEQGNAASALFLTIPSIQPVAAQHDCELDPK